MTTGSAASQHRPDRQVRHSPFPLSGRQIDRHARQRHLPYRSTATTSTPGWRRTRVLVIADRASVALELQRALAAAGYRTVGPATSRAEAKRLLSRFAVDCAIVDPDAGCADSTELVERLGTPFVILTSRMDPPPAYVSRPRLHAPVEREDVVAAIERAIVAAPPSDEIQYRIAPPSVSWPRVFPQL